MKLSAGAKEALADLIQVSDNIKAQPFLSLSREAQCSYLASLKAGVHQATAALTELIRRCDSAVLLWESMEVE